MRPQNETMDALLDLYGSLKDEVMELKERSGSNTHNAVGHDRSVAPGHTHHEPWTPCNQEEVRFYASLTHLH